MHEYIKRDIEKIVQNDLLQFPAVALIGPRQCGKSTLAKRLGKMVDQFIYIDCERPSDARILGDPELFFSANQGALICIDEIQRVPDIFPIMRSVIDDQKRPGQFLILGSASRDLLQQSSETLAGRISYNELAPFAWNEIHDTTNQNDYWLRGGFPDSLLTETDDMSARWRANFIRTYLERDIPQLGFNIPADAIARLWTMCAHYHGQLLNSSALGNSLNISSTTVRSHLNILEHTFMLRLLPPWSANTKKRMVKSPKMYLRDSGILHELLEIRTMNDLLGHPQVGASWEGVAIENIIASLPNWRPSFYRTSNGAEVDLVMERSGHRLVFECKASSDPKLSRGFYSALEELQPDATYIVVPNGEKVALKNEMSILPLEQLAVEMQQYM